MLRKFAVLTVIVAMLSMALVVSAQDPATDGCYASPTTLTINEGVSTTITFACANIPVSNRVFGFQMGTSLPESGVGADYVTLPTSYTEGEFSDVGFGATDGVVDGPNTLGMYALSRRSDQIVNAVDFTLGSYSIMSDTDNTADGSIAITFIDDALKLSNDLGAPLTGWLRTDNDTAITVNNIDLAWLTGTATVQSDSAAIGRISAIQLNIGGKVYTPATNTVPLATTLDTYTVDLDMKATYTYVEDASGDAVSTDGVEGLRAVAADGDGTLNIAVTADMFGHLACTTSVVDLGDTGAAQNVNAVTGIGTAGVITLKAGDADNDGAIDNMDSTVIGWDFSDSDTDINSEYQADVNLDNTVDIYDLVHVGRNFGENEEACS